MQQESIQSIFEELQEVNKEIQDLEFDEKPINFLLGVTGSGKSSLIAYLLGASMEYEKKKGKYYLKHNDSKKFPVIGNDKFASETTKPKTFDSGKQLFTDLAGYMDTRGIKQEILNNFTIRNVFQNVQQLRIILVFERAQFEASRGKMIVQTIERLKSLFHKDFKVILNACLLVISKVNIQQIQEQEIFQEVEEFYKSKSVKNNEQLSQFLQTIIKKKRIVVFPYPKFMNDKKRSQIISQLSKIAPQKLQYNPELSLSEEAEKMITKKHRGIKKRIKQTRNSLVQYLLYEYQQNIKNQIQILKTQIQKVTQIKTILKGIKYKKDVSQDESQDESQDQNNEDNQSTQKAILEAIYGQFDFYYGNFQELSQDISNIYKCYLLYPELDPDSFLMLDALSETFRQTLSNLEKRLQKIKIKSQNDKRQKVFEQKIDKLLSEQNMLFELSQGKTEQKIQQIFNQLQQQKNQHLQEKEQLMYYRQKQKEQKEQKKREEQEKFIKQNEQLKKKCVQLQNKPAQIQYITSYQTKEQRRRRLAKKHKKRR